MVRGVGKLIWEHPLTYMLMTPKCQFPAPSPPTSLSWLYQTVCGVLNATPFLKLFSWSTSRNVNILSLSAICLANFYMLIKVRVAHCILRYALLGASRRLRLHSLTATPKATSTDHLQSTCLRVVVVEDSDYLLVCEQ